MSVPVPAHPAPDPADRPPELAPLEADRHPFLNISHPLGFVDGMTPEEHRLVDQGLARRPPRLILLDGYTERTILPDSAARRRLLDGEYQALGQVSGGRFPVRLFVLRTGAGNGAPSRSAPAVRTTGRDGADPVPARRRP